MTLTLTRPHQAVRAAPPPPALLPSPPLPDPLNAAGPSRQPLTPTRTTHPRMISHLQSPPSPKTAQAAPARAGTSVSKAGQTPAEAYASAHQPRKVKDGPSDPGPRAGRKEVSKVIGSGREDISLNENVSHPIHGHTTAVPPGGSNTKPIFDWITRKLGGHRRASIAEPPRNGSTLRTGPATTANDARNRYPSLPRNIRQTNGAGVANTDEPPIKKRLDPTRPTPTPAKAPAPLPHVVQNGQVDLSLITRPSPIPQRAIAGPFRPLASGPRLSPTQIFPQTPARESYLSRSESHSLQSYSLFSASPSERERRREANNPYPSMPIQLYRPRGSIMTTSTSAWASASVLEEGDAAPSMSYRTRSRTSSMRSERSISSSLRPRISIAEETDGGDSSIRRRVAANEAEDGDGDDISRVPDELEDDDASGSANVRTPRGADENASIRPLPPSHPSSPTPSQSILSRSASASLLSPRSGRPRTPPSPFRPLSGPGRQTPDSYMGNSQHSEGYAYDEIMMPGRQSRQDSTSTKPTTVVSFDSGQPVAHIAQVPIMTATTSSAPATLPAGSIIPGPAVAATLAPPIPAVSASSAQAVPPVLSPITIPSPLTTSPIASTVATPSVPLQSTGSPNSTGPNEYRIDSPLEDQEYPPDETPQPSPPLSAPAHPVQFADSLSYAQAPKHTLPHPIHNPRPSSPPPDNASTLTLASSTFAFPAAGTSASGAGAAGGAGSLNRTSIGRLSMVSSSAYSGVVSSAYAPAVGTVPPGVQGHAPMGFSIGPSRPALSASPSVTFAPMPEPHAGLASSANQGQGILSHHHYHASPTSYTPHRPSSLAPSYRSASADHTGPDSSDPTHRHPPALASPLCVPAPPEREREVQKEYPPSLHPTLGTRASGYGWPGRPDEGASTRAVRRKGSEGSVASFESRWSWRGTGAAAAGPSVVSPGGVSFGAESRAGSASASAGAGRRVSDYSYVLPVADDGSSRRGSLVR